MKQLIQNFKTGDLYVDDVPVPSISQNTVLVENKFSLISAGTERGTVKVGKANLIGKARQRPDLVAQVLQNVKKEGLKATLNKVKTKLDSLKALGYSTSGVVRASMDSNGKFKPGDRVACAGQDYASHAEIVNIPQNLVAKIPDNVSFEDASYTTLGAIALQGVRQAETRLGDKVCVIGLGLLGQLTIQLLKANGCQIFGIDLSNDLVKLAQENGADNALNRADSNLKSTLSTFTDGHGFDSIIITAATPSNDPIELSAEITRKKGKVIVVGAVKMDIPRDPDFYRKELDLRMSCSYGPGRYDINYEENGNDYPYAYVRYTEQRNMETFLALLSSGKISIKHLTTHSFVISEALKAYDIILGKTEEPHIGILLEYPDSNKATSQITTIQKAQAKNNQVGFIGAGSFAQSYLIPNVKNLNTTLNTVVTSKGISGKSVAQKFNFLKASTNPDDVLTNKDIQTVFIATPHNSHAKYTINALNENKNVFVEKPLEMTINELNDVKHAYQNSTGKLMVGYNRRFSSLATKIKDEIKSSLEPKVVNIRVNAGFLEKEHWIQNPNVGGGRIIGEICHFVDLAQFFTGSKPVNVSAVSINSENAELTPNDNINITITFQNGSIANIMYLANGDKSLPKELIEVFCGGKVGRILDFRSGYLHSGNKIQKLKLSGKGHKEEVTNFIEVLNSKESELISFESLYLTTLTTFKIHDALTTGMPQTINL